MTYCYEIIKDSDVSDELFESAFYCAVESIKSMLYDYEVEVSVELPNIYISPPKDMLEVPFSIKRCNEIVSGAFINSAGEKYQEFHAIKFKEWIKKILC